MLNQRRPILPARLQTSTFGVRMLNYCVRHGNRWNHPAIVTRYSNIKDLYLENYTEEIACFETFQKTHVARSTSANRASLTLAFLGRFRVRPVTQSCFAIARILGQVSKVKALDLLVFISSTPYGASTLNLSTLSSSRSLTSLCYEILHLRTGFTLRCFQRLSLPDADTRPCRWRDNRYTGGPSTPVLSY